MDKLYVFIDDVVYLQGVPECVLFVAQRLTKYPLLLEPLLKTAGDDANERELLQRALCGVKVNYTSLHVLYGSKSYVVFFGKWCRI